MSVKQKKVRSHYIGTYLSTEDAQVIFDQCKKLNVSASEFVRIAITHGYHSAVGTLTKRVNTTPSIFEGK